MREGTASGPLSTTPRHICQIRGISATREPRIGGERNGRDSHLSHAHGVTLLREKKKFRNMSPGLNCNRKKIYIVEFIVNKLHAINKT